MRILRYHQMGTVPRGNRGGTVAKKGQTPGGKAHAQRNLCFVAWNHNTAPTHPPTKTQQAGTHTPHQHPPTPAPTKPHQHPPSQHLLNHLSTHLHNVVQSRHGLQVVVGRRACTATTGEEERKRLAAARAVCSARVRRCAGAAGQGCVEGQSQQRHIRLEAAATAHQAQLWRQLQAKTQAAPTNACQHPPPNQHHQSPPLKHPTRQPPAPTKPFKQHPQSNHHPCSYPEAPTSKQLNGQAAHRPDVTGCGDALQLHHLISSGRACGCVQESMCVFVCRRVWRAVMVVVGETGDE